MIISFNAFFRRKFFFCPLRSCTTCTVYFFLFFKNLTYAVRGKMISHTPRRFPDKPLNYSVVILWLLSWHVIHFQSSLRCVSTVFVSNPKSPQLSLSCSATKKDDSVDCVELVVVGRLGRRLVWTVASAVFWRGGGPPHIKRVRENCLWNPQSGW